MARGKKIFRYKLNPNDLTNPKIVKSVSDNCDCIEFNDNFNSKSVNNVEIDSEHHTKQVIEECFKSIIDTTESTSDVFNLSEEGMYLTEQIQVPFSEDLSKICHLSKNLYNFANMMVRQIYFYKTREDYCIMPKAMVYLKDFLAEDKFLNYNSLYAIIKNTDHYKTLPAQTAQQTLKLLHQDWIDYWKAKKKWNLDPTRLFGKPKIPSFKKKYNGEHNVMFTNQQVRTKRNLTHFEQNKRTYNNGNLVKITGEILFPRKANIKPIRTTVSISNIKYIRILPRVDHYILEVIYPKKIINLGLNKNNAIAIDIGVNNLLSIVNNIGLNPILVKGKFVKSINQFANKQIAKYRSISNKSGVFVQSMQEKRIWRKRKNRIRDYFHKASRYVVDYCKKNDIGIIVIGYNTFWKQTAQLNKRNMQNFVYIPFLDLIHKIKYKAKLLGIRVNTNEESYTSQDCCFCGRRRKLNRISRGVYKCDICGRQINSDISSAYNIGQRVYPILFKDLESYLKLKPPIAVNI